MDEQHGTLDGEVHTLNDGYQHKGKTRHFF